MPLSGNVTFPKFSFLPGLRTGGTCPTQVYGEEKKIVCQQIQA